MGYHGRSGEIARGVIKKIIKAVLIIIEETNHAAYGPACRERGSGGRLENDLAAALLEISGQEKRLMEKLARSNHPNLTTGFSLSARRKRDLRGLDAELIRAARRKRKLSRFSQNLVANRPGRLESEAQAAEVDRKERVFGPPISCRFDRLGSMSAMIARGIAGAARDFAAAPPSGSKIRLPAAITTISFAITSGITPIHAPMIIPVLDSGPSLRRDEGERSIENRDHVKLDRPIRGSEAGRASCAGEASTRQNRVPA